MAYETCASSTNILSHPIYQQPKERFLFLFVTNECTLRCKHCFVGNDRLNAAERMSLAQVEEYLDYFRAFGGHDKLYILGGEPTLHPNLPEMVDAANARGYSVTISSNGDFDDTVFDAMPPDKLKCFNFSVEGPDVDTHSRIRGRRTNFSRVTNRIRTAVDRGYQVRLLCTVTKTNRHRAIEMIDLGVSLGVDLISYHNLGLTGNAAHMQRPLDPDEWMAFCKEIEDLPPRKDIAVYYPPSFVNSRDLKKYFERGYPGCPARTGDRIFIYPDGTTYRCPLLMDGERYSYRFEDGRLHPANKKGNENDILFEMPQICRGCDHNQACGGGCPAFDAVPPHDSGLFSCDRQTVPLCMLWSTYAWDNRPQSRIHDYR